MAKYVPHLVATATLAGSLIASVANGSEISFGASDIPTVFFISKSDDHNRVDYGMRLNAACTAPSNDAVFPYWREFEHSPPVRTHPLGTFEYLGYGLSEQKLVHAGKPDAAYLIRLKQFRQRPIWITTTRDAAGHCHSLARCDIAGSRNAELSSIYLKLAGKMSVEYMLIKGRNRETGELIEERVNR
jgi:hypothetical protein